MNQIIIYFKNLWSDIKWFFVKEEPKLLTVVEAEVTVIESNHENKGEHMSWFIMIMQLMPYVVAGIHALHPAANTETKTQIATNLINIAATGVINTGAVTGQNAALTAVAANTATALLSATTPVVPSGMVPPPAAPAVAPVSTAVVPPTA